MAGKPRVQEQHIAVFGGSGSGKTVLLSSLYGATQEPTFQKDSLFDVVADDTGQGNRLRQNYLGMKNSAKAPEANRFVSVSYSFTIKPKHQSNSKAAKSRPFDASRFVWHDYPGEWFEQEPSSELEAGRRLDTFRALLRSDVALILVDGQQLLDHAGEEEKYLKSLFWGLRDGILRLKDDLLDEGEPLSEFPRIWVVALSKADLHPDLDVRTFQDLVVEKAAGDLSALHDTVKTLVQHPEALSMGEDFIVLSSAKFEPGSIDVTERLGVSLLVPIATVLPLERLVQWHQKFQVPNDVLRQLVDNADAWGSLLLASPFLRVVLRKVPKVGPVLERFAIPAIALLVKSGIPKLKEMNADARAKGDYLTALLTQFQLDIEQGVGDALLVKSLK